jgi:hypothetical protein
VVGGISEVGVLCHTTGHFFILLDIFSRRFYADSFAQILHRIASVQNENVQ